MKQLALTIFIALIALNTSAQDTTHAEKKQKVRLDRGPKIYITTSTGANNNTAILGFNFELPVNPYVTIDGGAGTGTWNNVIYLGSKYYLKPAQRGFAFGTGLMVAGGTRAHTYHVTTVSGKEMNLPFNKNTQTNVLFAAYKYWNLGKQYNRFYLEMGYTVPVTGGDKVTQLAGPRASIQSIHSLGHQSPEGPVLAFGFSFGLH